MYWGCGGSVAIQDIVKQNGKENVDCQVKQHYQFPLSCIEKDRGKRQRRVS